MNSDAPHLSPAPEALPKIHIHWDSEQSRGGMRIARTPLLPENRHRSPLHDHDFCEIMVVESGVCEHRIGDLIERLEPGAYRCLRPHDVHVPRSGGGPCTILNISFAHADVEGLAARCGDAWLWPADGPPRGGHLTAAMQERFSSWLVLLSTERIRAIDRDSFLIDLVRMLNEERGTNRSAGLPDWLAQVLESYADPRVLSEGVRGLARRCDCSAEHLNRVIQAGQGRRTTDLINALRLDWIAMRLRLSDDPITAISAACGLPNQANFYKLFQAAYGVTPAAWRREARDPFPGNESQLVVPWRQRKI